LVARTPVFGDTLLGLTAVPGSFVLQYVSFPGTVPVQISPTCFVHLHLPTASSIGAFVVGGAGTHDLVFTLPPLPMLWGLSLRYQALVVPPTLGLALSNAVDTLVGF
jgi:hypothetical protein